MFWEFIFLCFNKLGKKEPEMNEKAILQALNEVFIEVLDDEDIVLTYETDADDIEDWDSLSHIQLIVSVEKHFHVQFKTQEVQEFANVGSICNAILNHMAKSDLSATT